MQQVNEFESAIHQQRRQTTESGTVMANKLSICSEVEADCEYDHGGIRCNRRRSIGGSSTQSSPPPLLLQPAKTTKRDIASVSTVVPSSPADIRNTGCTETSEHTVNSTTTTTLHDDCGDDDGAEEERKELLLLLEQQNLMRNDFNVAAAYNCHGSNSGISSHCLRFDGVRGTTSNITTNVSPVPQTVNYEDFSAVAGKCSHKQTGCWWFGDFGRRRRSTSICNCEYHRIIKRSSNTETTFGERLIVATESWKAIQNININNAGYAVAYENQEAANRRQQQQSDDSLGEKTLDLVI